MLINKIGTLWINQRALSLLKVHSIVLVLIQNGVCLWGVKLKKNYTLNKTHSTSDTALPPSYSGTFYFHRFGCLSRTSSCWVFGHAREVGERTGSGRDELQLSSRDWKVASFRETSPEEPCHRTVNVYVTAHLTGEQSRFRGIDDVRAADADVPRINCGGSEGSDQCVGIVVRPHHGSYLLTAQQVTLAENARLFGRKNLALVRTDIRGQQWVKVERGVASIRRHFLSIFVPEHLRWVWKETWLTVVADQIQWLVENGEGVCQTRLHMNGI